MSARESQIDVRTALKQGLAQLREAHVPSYTLAAELLLLHVLGRDRTWIYSHPEEKISSADADRYFALIARRKIGEPTQHLTGKQEFWGFEFEAPEFLFAGEVLRRLANLAAGDQCEIAICVRGADFFFRMGVNPGAVAAEDMEQQKFCGERVGRNMRFAQLGEPLLQCGSYVDLRFSGTH